VTRQGNRKPNWEGEAPAEPRLEDAEKCGSAGASPSRNGPPASLRSPWVARPRTHTWMHLLPADAAFDCRGGPEWLRAPLAGAQTQANRRVVVEYNGTLSDPAAAAFVGINCSGVKDASLQAAGFANVCRFAVLPGWENPRWFIPLASPAVCSAGFDLYTPARATARLKRLAARAAVYTRLPFWYRDQVVIAQREPSSLQRAMSELFPGHGLALAFSSGAPEGARNRKASAAVIDSDGTILAFLKIAVTPLARALLERETENLRRLSSMDGVRGFVPSLLSAGEIDGIYTTAQAPLAGGAAPTPIGPMHHEFLSRLARQTAEPAATRLVAELPRRIASLAEPHPELSAALEQALAGLENQRMATGLVHGDFAPWNLRRAGNVIRAFDWEYGHLDGPAGLDEIHYRLQVGYLLDNWTVEKAVADLTRTDILSRYCSQSRQSSRHALLMLYLVDTLARLYGEGYDRANDMVKWHARLLDRLRESAPREAVLT